MTKAILNRSSGLERRVKRWSQGDGGSKARGARLSEVERRAGHAGAFTRGCEMKTIMVSISRVLFIHVL